MKRSGPRRRQREREGTQRDARMAVVRRYARLSVQGFPVKCRASDKENQGRVSETDWYADDRVIYDSVQIAWQAAVELEMLGAPRLRARECERSRHGHAHLERATGRSKASAG